MMKDSEKINLLNQHSRHLTRRDFISLGLTVAGGVAFAPTIFHALGRAHAFAEGIEVQPSIPFITFDLAGGAGLPGNFLVGKSGGPEDLLSSYSNLGWNPRQDGYDSRFGLPMAKTNISKIFEGLTTAMSPEAQKQFRLSSVLHTARDDTSDNPLSIAQLVSKSGLQGKSISPGVGMVKRESGGNSRSVKEYSEYSCQYIQKIDDLLSANAVSLPLRDLGKDSVNSVFKKIRSLSGSQAKRALSGTQNTELFAFLDNRFKEAGDFSSSAPELDPRANALTQAIYGVTQNTADRDVAAVRASLALGTLTGETGPAVITIGGCDYHTGTQAPGDTKDLEIGREIGRAVELAHRMKRPLFIHMITDGGVSSGTGNRNWTSDNGEKCMSVFGVYDPHQVPEYISGQTQVGNYTDGQGANRDHFLGASPALAGYSVFANYLNLSGKMDLFEKMLGRVITDEQMKEVLTFAPLKRS